MKFILTIFFIAIICCNFSWGKGSEKETLDECIQSIKNSPDKYFSEGKIQDIDAFFTKLENENIEVTTPSSKAVTEKMQIFPLLDSEISAFNAELRTFLSSYHFVYFKLTNIMPPPEIPIEILRDKIKEIYSIAEDKDDMSKKIKGALIDARIHQVLNNNEKVRDYREINEEEKDKKPATTFHKKYWITDLGHAVANLDHRIHFVSKKDQHEITHFENFWRDLSACTKLHHKEIENYSYYKVLQKFDNITSSLGLQYRTACNFFKDEKHHFQQSKFKHDFKKIQQAIDEKKPLREILALINIKHRSPEWIKTALELGITEQVLIMGRTQHVTGPQSVDRAEDTTNDNSSILQKIQIPIEKISEMLKKDKKKSVQEPMSEFVLRILDFFGFQLLDNSLDLNLLTSNKHSGNINFGTSAATIANIRELDFYFYDSDKEIFRAFMLSKFLFGGAYNLNQFSPVEKVEILNELSPTLFNGERFRAYRNVENLKKLYKDITFTEDSTWGNFKIKKKGP